MLAFIICTLLALNIAVESISIPESRAAVRTTYTLWKSEEANEAYGLDLTVEEGATFFEVMGIAAELDNNFRFTSTNSDFGNFITSIGGVENDPVNNVFWFIYVLDDLPNINDKPSNDLLAQTGVDGILVEDGAHYLFWFTSVDDHE